MSALMSNLSTATATTRRRLMAGLAAGACAMAALRPAAAQQVSSRRDTPAASGWSSGLHSRVRLVDVGAMDGAGRRMAVIEIALDKGFKTYWRTPGDSGIPPTFSFAGSTNAQDIHVHFPAPGRFDDGAGGQSLGYLGPLVRLPVTFRQPNPAQPATLALRMDYAVCEKICVPASAEARVQLPAAAAISAEAGRIAREHLPQKQPLAAAGDMAVMTLARGPKAETFVVEATAPAGSAADLFVEAASPWAFDARKGASQPDGRVRFEVLAIERDKAPDCKGVEVTITLTAGGRAIETTTWLDVSLISH